MNMSRLSRTGLGVACLCAALVASMAPAGAKTFRSAAIDDPQTLDPHSANLLPTARVLNQIYEGLVSRDATWKIVPWLATEWSNQGEKTWRFKLRRDVTFHDGTPMTADDVIFSVERALAPTSQMKITLQGVDKAVRVDDHTVDFLMREPNPVLPAHLFQFKIVSRAWATKNNATVPQNFKEKEDSFAARNTNGTGPFMLKSRQTDVRTVLVRNPNWWGNKAGHWQSNIEEAIILPIRSNPTRMAALVSGEVDFVIDPAPQDVAKLKSDPALKVITGGEARAHVITFDVFRDELLYGSEKTRNPFKDLRVRQAVAHAIDMDAIVRVVMRGMARPVGVVVTPEVQGYPKDIDKRLPFSRPRAQQLLKEAGYANGFDVTFDCGNNTPAPEICTAVAGMLANVGIRAKPNLMPTGVLFPKVEKHDTSLYLMSWGTGNTSDALYSLQLLYKTKGERGDGDFNLGRYSNPKVDALVSAIKVEPDMKKRDALVREAFQIINTELPQITLHQPILPWAMRKNVSVVHAPNNVLYLHRVKVN
jgi:peptide/nickel transport system substrate-binding protein